MKCLYYYYPLFKASYIQRKIDELETKWFSTRCYLKNYSNEKQELYLTSLKTIEKNELVARFSASLKSPNSHYIRHDSIHPTCYLEGNEVFAIDCIQPNTELTLNFNGEY